MSKTMIKCVTVTELGKKAEHIGFAAEGRYDNARMLMIGDAPGDYRAAAANDCLFFPINPGEEEASWQRFHDEGIDRFLTESFAGDYQQALLDEFDKYLPEPHLRRQFFPPGYHCRDHLHLVDR